MNHISIAAEHNFEKWNESFGENVDDRGLSSWEEEIDYVKRFIAERSAYMTVSLSAYQEEFRSLYKENGIYWGIMTEIDEITGENIRIPYKSSSRIQLVAQNMEALYTNSIQETR